MLSLSCENKAKVVAIHQFSDGTTITVYQKGSELHYESNKGIVKVNGDIMVVEKPNKENFTDPRWKVRYFSAAYNVNLPDPILSFDEYYEDLKIYPKSGLIAAAKKGDTAGATLYSLRTIEGNKFVFPEMDNQFHLCYTDVCPNLISINDNTGVITMPGLQNKSYAFTIKDIKPEWIKNKMIYLNFSWYIDLSQVRSGGEYKAFKYEGNHIGK